MNLQRKALFKTMLDGCYIYRMRVDPIAGQVQVQVFDLYGDGRLIDSSDGKFLLTESSKACIVSLQGAIWHGSNVDKQELGGLLFDALFDEKLSLNFYNHYEKCKNDKKLLRVELDMRDPEIASWPWEFLCTPQNSDYPSIIMATDPSLSLSRYIGAYYPRPVQTPHDEEISVLIIVSMPDEDELTRIRYQTTLSEIRNLFPNARCELLTEPTIESIERKLEYIKPHIFHFIGHGKRGDGSQQKMGQIALVDRVSKRAHWIDGLQFANSFSVHVPQVVILQACEGAASTVSDIFTSVASQIIKKQVPIVVAMQHEITSASAKNFVQAFYKRWIENKEPVFTAVQMARRHLDISYNSKPDFAIPVLFVNTNISVYPKIRSQPTAYTREIAKEPLEQSIIEPDADFLYGNSLSSLYAFSPDTAFNNLTPFELGMIWGLNRSCFIGLTAARDENLIYNYLMQTERAIADSYKRYPSTEPVEKLPERWWIKVDIIRSPNGPGNEQDVWKVASDPQDPRVQYLLTKGMPPHRIPGILITIRLPQQNELARWEERMKRQKDRKEAMKMLTEVILKWYQSLLQSAFSREQVAIVINVCEDDSKQVRDFLAALQIQLQNNQEGVPAEVMIPLVASADLEEISVTEEDNNPFVARPPAVQPGAHFFKWAEYVHATAELTQKRVEKEQYSLIMEECLKLRRRTPDISEENIVGQSAGRVVADLDWIAPYTSQGLDKLFLRFIADYAPERIHSLIYAYAARSERREARRTALVFAASSAQIPVRDYLLDAWIAGIETCPEHFPVRDELFPQNNELPFIDDLALAIVRFCKPDRASEIIEPFRRLLKSDVRAVCEQAFKATKEEDASVLTYDESLLNLAVRARVYSIVPLKHIKRFLALENSSAWWLMMSVSPTLECILELLQLNDEQRAVLGLCTGEEWSKLCEDSISKQQIIDSRYQRSICYRYAPAT